MVSLFCPAYPRLKFVPKAPLKVEAMILSNYLRLVAPTAIFLAAATIGCSSTHQATGEGNGALTSNSMAAAEYFPTVQPRGANRYPHLSNAHAQLVVNQHVYPPTAR